MTYRYSVSGKTSVRSNGKVRPLRGLAFVPNLAGPAEPSLVVPIIDDGLIVLVYSGDKILLRLVCLLISDRVPRVVELRNGETGGMILRGRIACKAQTRQQ